MLGLKTSIQYIINPRIKGNLMLDYQIVWRGPVMDAPDMARRAEGML